MHQSAKLFDSKNKYYAQAFLYIYILSYKKGYVKYKIRMMIFFFSLKTVDITNRKTGFVLYIFTTEKYFLYPITFFEAYRYQRHLIFKISLFQNRI